MTFLTLLLWGSLFVRFWVSGDLGEYLHPSFHNLVMGAGLGLIAMAVAWYWATSRGMAGHGCECCGGHETREARIGAFSNEGVRIVISCSLLMVSFAGALALSGGGYNEVHLINRQLITSPDQAPSLNETGRVAQLEQLLSNGSLREDIGVDLLLLAAERAEWRNFLSHKKVNSIGQLRTNGSQSHIVRLLSICCAADARPLGIGVSTEDVVGFSTGDWVIVEGQVEFSEDNGHFSPRLTQVKLTKTDAPENVILY